MTDISHHHAVALDLGVHELAEGPCWDRRNETLTWVDIMAGNVHTWHPQSDARSSLASGQPVGAAVPREQGGYVLALRDGVALSTPTGEVAWLVPNLLRDGLRFNDAKCDARGRLWAGAIALGNSGEPGELYRVDPDGTATRMDVGVTLDKGLGLTNGMGWSPDGHTYYLIDTLSATVLAFDFDVETGTLANERTFLRLDGDQGYPDGMCVDVEGGLWIARFGGHRVDRFDAHANHTDQVKVPASQVTCPVLGEGDMRTLFITTAWENMSAPGEEDGKLYKTTVRVAGLQPHWFAG